MNNHGTRLTWKPPATQGFAPPWNPERYAELDICIVRDRWRNAITNVQSDIRTNIDSDDIALHVNIRHKNIEIGRRNYRQLTKGIKLIGKDGGTSDLVRVRYLERAKVYLRESSNALWKAAEETLDTRKKGMCKRRTHPEIKSILDERRRAVNEFNQQETRRLTNKLKRKAKQIRAKRIIDSLEEGKWDPVKLGRSDFFTPICEN